MRPWRVGVMAGAALMVPLIGFAGYTVRRGRSAPRVGADVVVVLGCRLRGNRVAPMLARRLDRAVEVVRRERGRGGAPLVVVSGGQAGRETVAEAAAMADYLVAHGVSADAIVMEDRSRNTEENLRFTARELRRRGIDPEAARITVVTSDFHVLRTKSLAHGLGLRAQVTGARTARLLSRRSFFREFAAVLVMRHRIVA
ncbi:YdcF family protein [Nocardia sp. CDC153]|uniref:YdcF family protein n=1 Tax=Nocardia sp. CDC153 TaxID=3112167 RepID=UPI002DB9EACD|nr:YdcF family protein [Nocardia sp. CDC153]MEC3953905.1 YdcF family protein [Nocardia sp. CDC153]